VDIGRCNICMNEGFDKRKTEFTNGENSQATGVSCETTSWLEEIEIENSHYTSIYLIYYCMVNG